MFIKKNQKKPKKTTILNLINNKNLKKQLKIVKLPK